MREAQRPGGRYSPGPGRIVKELTADFISPSRFAILIAGVDWAACPAKHGEKQRVKERWLHLSGQMPEMRIAHAQWRQILAEQG